MSWFEYGTLSPKKRKLRKGVWLRVGNLPAHILKEARSKMRSKLEQIEWVVVSEMRPENKVLLEFWCRTPVKDMLYDRSCRYTVFYVLATEDPTWICEGDLGRGYKE